MCIRDRAQTDGDICHWILHTRAYSVALFLQAHDQFYGHPAVRRLSDPTLLNLGFSQKPTYDEVFDMRYRGLVAEDPLDDCFSVRRAFDDSA